MDALKARLRKHRPPPSSAAAAVCNPSTDRPLSLSDFIHQSTPTPTSTFTFISPTSTSTRQLTRETSTKHSTVCTTTIPCTLSISALDRYRKTDRQRQTVSTGWLAGQHCTKKCSVIAHTHTQTREQEEEKWLKATDKSRLKNRQRQLQTTDNDSRSQCRRGKDTDRNRQAGRYSTAHRNKSERKAAHKHIFSVCVLAVQLSKQPARKKVCC